MEIEDYGRALLKLLPADADLLGRIVLRSLGDDAVAVRAITRSGAADEYVVTAGGYVGRLGLPSGAVLDFNSRFKFLDMIEVLSQGAVLSAKAPSTEVALAAAPLRVDHIANAWARSVEQLLAHGLGRGYRQRKTESPPHGGRLLPVDQLRTFPGRADRLVTARRHLSVDISENQALLRAHAVLSSVPLMTDTTIRLRRLAPAFAGITRSRPTALDVRRIRLDRRTSRYRPALALTAAIIEGGSLGPFAGALQATSLLFPTPPAWEFYVVAEAARALTRDFVVKPKYSFGLSDSGHTGEADALVLIGHQPVAVIDAKYKEIGQAPTTPDLYQMITYLHRLRLDTAVLVYPGAGGDRVVRVGANRLHILALRTEDTDFSQRLLAVMQQAHKRQVHQSLEGGAA